jgi:hypothetical protein
MPLNPAIFPREPLNFGGGEAATEADVEFAGELVCELGEEFDVEEEYCCGY